MLTYPSAQRSAFVREMNKKVNNPWQVSIALNINQDQFITGKHSRSIIHWPLWVAKWMFHLISLEGEWSIKFLKTSSIFFRFIRQSRTAVIIDHSMMYWVINLPAEETALQVLCGAGCSYLVFQPVLTCDKQWQSNRSLTASKWKRWLHHFFFFFALSKCYDAIT